MRLPWRVQQVSGSESSDVMHDVFQSNGSVNSMAVTRDDDFVSQSVVRDDRVGSEMIVGESLNDDAELMLVSE
jgi:hypothetical protein